MRRCAARTRDIARIRGFGSVLFVPLLSDKGPIGAISVTRTEPGSFAAHHVQLLQTFADQAVIAIENVRLFNEVQAKTRDLTESLQQQTATSEVLKVISSSPGDLEPVFQKMLENATRVCGANLADESVRTGRFQFRRALQRVPPASAASPRKARPIPPALGPRPTSSNSQVLSHTRRANAARVSRRAPRTVE